ncbi:MAG: hypothetical protein H6943_05830 [Zoogloeaceae bacterium]|nr:hypothetical protein [Zoogloeaceae bacterium]
MNTASTPTVPLTRLTPGRRALLLTLLLFILPVAVGGGLFYFDWRPSSTGNHGELITPPRPMPVAMLEQKNNNPDTAASIKGKWLLLIAGNGICDQACVQLARQARAIQVSLNRDMGRMRRVVLNSGASPALSELQAEQPDLIVAEASPEWLAGLGIDTTTQSPQRLFLVDPAGNLMMQYAPGAEPKGIRADLERLLKYSWIG